MRRLALIAFALAACVKDPPTAPVMCESSDECDPGKTCDDGVCYGLPPDDLAFAAVLYPPEGVGLAPTEITSLDIAADGTISNLAFTAPTILTGAVTFDGIPISARLELRKASLIPNGPDLVITTETQAEEEGQFRMPIPQAQIGERYRVTIIPQGEQRLEDLPGSPLVSEVAPRTTFEADLGGAEPEVTWEISPAGGLHAIEGTIRDIAERPVEGAKVTAFGGMEGNPHDRPSSVAVTGADGHYRIYCLTSWDDDVNLVVEVRTETDAVVLTRLDVPAPGPEEPGGEERSPRLDVTLPPHPSATKFTLPIIGTNPAGGELPAVGATVVARSTQIALEDDMIEFQATASTDEDGRAELWLIPGEPASNRVYSVDVVSPAGSPLGSRWGAELMVASPGVLPMLALPSRAYVTGKILSADREPVPGTVVLPIVSIDVQNGLTPADRALLAQQVVEPVAVDAEGGFAVYLDPVLNLTQLTYDLDVQPPADSLSPRWSYEGVIALGQPSTPGLQYANLPGWALPAASFARGPVVDANGAPVPGAQLRVFSAGTPARLRALTTADEGGLVRRLALPDPPGATLAADPP